MAWYNFKKKKESNTLGKGISNEEVKRADRKRQRNIQKDIRKQTLYRITASINMWQQARKTAENLLTPNNTELLRVYKDIEVDSHLHALMQTIRLKTMANSFSIVDENGEIDKESTKMFQKMWFRKIIKEKVDAKFYGFSLMQLGDIVNGCFSSSTLVPRHYVVQQLGGIKKNLGSTDLIYFNDPKYKNWLVPIGDTDDLGILDKAAPLVIKKKEVLSAWSEAAEIFGMPLRYMKTKISDDDKREEAEGLMEDLGGSAWAVIDEDDEIVFAQTSRTDISNMYNSFVERINSELSKLVLLQTGTTDEKSHVGAAGVMENVLKSLIESYLTDVEDLANEIVIPIAQRHGLMPLGRYLKAADEQKLTLKELFEIVKELLPHAKIPKEWISETFEIPIKSEDADLNGIEADEAARRIIKSSVGGVTALVAIKQSVADGASDIPSAIAMVKYIYGFDDDKAKEMIGNIKVQPKEAPAVKKDGTGKDEVMKAVNELYNNDVNCC